MNQTSWDKVADWYDDLLRREDTYQEKVILPQLLRAMAIMKGEMVLDLACGQGFFSKKFIQAGATVIGVDVSKKLIALAKKSIPQGTFYISSADQLSFLKSTSVHKIVIALAIQNIENINSVFKECARVIRPNGRLYIVMNHPAFRVPKQSSWGWDEAQMIQYRRIDYYLSESKVKIKTHPGDVSTDFTISFHRPLQSYFKALRNNGFLVRSMEEWESHKKSQLGPRAKAENRARKEIPMFIFIEAVKI
jgi:ubiquinone/menaquinone biosynthesis C-methylase UbiE